MEHICKYAILQAIPDARRGERVNVGVAAFLPDRLDIRFAGLAKMLALTGDRWDDYAQRISSLLTDSFDKGDAPEDVISRFSTLDDNVLFSDLAWFSAVNQNQYEKQIKEILSDLVDRPKKQKKAPTATRINTEIARELKRTKVLAGPDESIDQKKVVRDFYVSRDEELKADFALKNGVFHITTTLDLRLANVNMGQAALKAIVLDKVADELGQDSRRIGVYALAGEEARYRPHVELLKDYAQVTYNWLDANDRQNFMRGVFDAAVQPAGLLK